MPGFRPMMRVGLRLFLTLVLVGACALPECYYDMCEDDGASWCEGNVTHRCSYRDNYFDWVGYFLDISNCPVDYPENPYCVEARLEDGSTRAICAAALTPCPPGIESFCMDDTPAVCRSSYPRKMTPCTEYGKHCLHSRDGEKAECSYFPNRCEPEQRRCILENDPRYLWEGQYYHCSALGIWENIYRCPDPHVCVQIAPDRAECQ